MADDILTPEASDEREAGQYTLDGPFTRNVLEAVEVEDAERLAELLEPLHPADMADLLEQIEGWQRADLLRVYGGRLDGAVLSELDESLREEVIHLLPPDVLSEAVRELDSDDVVDLVEDLEGEQKDMILEALSASSRAAVEQALTYPEFSAGRLMQREIVRAPEHWRVGEAIDFLRANPDNLPDQFYHVVLVDPRMRAVGQVAIGKILASRRGTLLRDIVEEDFRTVPVDQDEGEVAYAFNQYHLISAPVVDEEKRVVGVITIDDAMVVMDEEHEEDILRLAGVGETRISDRVVDTTRRRLPWLAVNLATAILASLVIAQFEEVIAQVVALAVLMPIVASMGGNAGTQALTVAVRALATKDLTGSNVLRIVRREAAVGLINGVIFAILMGAVGILWFGDIGIAYVISAAMVINMLMAGLAGILIPLLLDKAGVDPALASGTFVTTVTDVVGFFAFLGLAALWLL
ncbi:magnesium transporter [Tropicimonas sp. IMCC34011]|uniref:magnesium transporter n=1 Tax=Tropicimonas sp. IMCC34011 TaxID=2248759 RepID=UPI000E2713C3|nr:magnesium transporter [Tropicimonas sp. IMCC34011]